MGVDLLDIEFRLDRTFRIKIDRSDWDRLVAEGVSAKTLTAGHLEALVKEKLAATAHQDDVARPCIRCEYDLRCLPPGSHCPECGENAAPEEQVWNGVRRVLRDVTGKKRADIRRESRLVADLGASL